MERRNFIGSVAAGVVGACAAPSDLVAMPRDDRARLQTMLDCRMVIPPGTYYLAGPFSLASSWRVLRQGAVLEGTEPTGAETLKGQGDTVTVSPGARLFLRPKTVES
jgi:hypothetical protein